MKNKTEILYINVIKGTYDLHGLDIQVFKDIYDLLRMLQLYNIFICFALQKYRYPEKRISEK